MFTTQKSNFLHFSFIIFLFIQLVSQSYALLDDQCQVLNDLFTFNKLYLYDTIANKNLINLTDKNHVEFLFTKYTKIDYDWSDENAIFEFNNKARNYILWYGHHYTDITSILPDLKNEEFISSVVYNLKVSGKLVYVPDVSEAHFSLDKSWNKTHTDCSGKAQYFGYYHTFSGFSCATKFVAGMRHELMCRYIQLFIHPINRGNKLDIQHRCLNG